MRCLVLPLSLVAVRAFAPLRAGLHGVHGAIPRTNAKFQDLKMVTADSEVQSASDRLNLAFTESITKKSAALVGYITAGYPTKDATVELLLSMERGGVNVIELGVPFTDPQADGATIQGSNQVALKNGVTMMDCIGYVREARSKGLTVPVVLMGYFNPFLAFGVDKLIEQAKEAGVDGLIIVDLPPEEDAQFIEKCNAAGLSFVPLITPTSTDERVARLSASAGSFLYCVSVTGITGGAGATAEDLQAFVGRVRKFTDKPLAVGFGIKTPEQVAEVSQIADGVVVGSAIVNSVSLDKSLAENAAYLEEFCASLKSGVQERSEENVAGKSGPLSEADAETLATYGDSHFGDFGGRYIPETLLRAHMELEAAYKEAMEDPAFKEEIDFYRREFIGGPTPLYLAKRLTEKCGGARIWLKREELAHTGAHKINNAVGQALLAKRLGKKRIIAETGAGQHGVASACVCALLDLDLTVYMGAVDCDRQRLNVFRMQQLGAKVVPVESGSATLKDAINEAMRDWVTNVRDTHYLIGSAIGPHPFPTIVRDFQSVIGREAREQMLEKAGKLPDYVVACVGGGSNAIGMFSGFVNDDSVKLVGVEAGGEGVDGLNSATLSMGKPGVLHGTRTYLLQDADGQIPETHSISAGLDYPGVGPEHAYLKDSGRAEYVAVTDKQALEAFQTLSRTEGIIPALEPSHAMYHAMQLAASLPKDKDVLINLCGRGDKDMNTVAKTLGFALSDGEAGVNPVTGEKSG